MGNGYDKDVRRRLEEVRAMDDYVRTKFYDENNIDEWLMYGCPDEASEDDYLCFAESADAYNGLVRLFNRLKAQEKEI